MFQLNTYAARRPYEESLRGLLGLAEGRAVRGRLKTWSGLSARPTPAWSLPGLACALVKLVLLKFPQQNWSMADLLAGRHASTLKSFVVIIMTVSDAQAEAAMRLLAGGTHGDMPIVAGESGVAGLAALQDLKASIEGTHAAGLDATSRVLLINTEGATAPGVCEAIVGRPAADVPRAQRDWQGNHRIAG